MRFREVRFLTRAHSELLSSPRGAALHSLLPCTTLRCGAAQAKTLWRVFLYIQIHFLTDVSYEIEYVNTVGKNANMRLQTLGREGLAFPDMPSARCACVTEFEPSR